MPVGDSGGGRQPGPVRAGSANQRSQLDSRTLTEPARAKPSLMPSMGATHAGDQVKVRRSPRRGSVAVLLSSYGGTFELSCPRVQEVQRSVVGRHQEQPVLLGQDEAVNADLGGNGAYYLAVRVSQVLTNDGVFVAEGDQESLTSRVEYSSVGVGMFAGRQGDLV
jgi:hypothetical protein